MHCLLKGRQGRTRLGYAWTAGTVEGVKELAPFLFCGIPKICILPSAAIEQVVAEDEQDYD